MTHDEMLIEVERLNSICSKPLGEQETQRRTAFLNELSRKFLWLTAMQWRDVLTWVIDNHKTRALPTIEEFSRGVNSLRSSGKIQGFRECESCNGSALVYRSFRHRPTGQIVEAMVPCPKCRGNNSIVPKADLEPMDEPRTRKQRLAEALSPRASQFALELATKLGCEFDDTTAVILIEKSCEEPQRPVEEAPLPANVESADAMMRKIVENRREQQAQFTPRRAAPKPEWESPTVDAQSRAAGERE